MKSYLYSLLWIILFTSTIIANTEAFNYTNIIRTFYLMCGPEYLCNATTHGFLYSYTSSYTHLNLCQKCRCDSNCFDNGNCCPDIFFAEPEQFCEESIFLDSTPYDNVDKYPMVKTCPTTTERENVELCTQSLNAVEKIQNAPVTSKTSGLTYHNKYCAQCHGDVDVVDWDLSISCYNKSDFNYVSSYEEVIKMVKDKQCTIRHKTTRTPVRKCVPNDDVYYDRCNITGYWKTFDEDIHYGCESNYVAIEKHNTFKNIFCYICNPTTIHEADLISNCNESGVWNYYDEEVEQACKNNEAISRTFPYKNIFCYICNINSSDSDIFQDVHSIMYSTRGGSEFRYKFHISGLKYEFYMQLLNQWVPLQSRIRQPVNVNITNILLQLYAQNPFEVGVCNVSLFPKNVVNVLSKTWRSCSCNPLDINNLCMDILLKYPPACLSNVYNFGFYGKTVEGYSASVSGCYKQPINPSLKQRCSLNIQDANDTFSFLRLKDENGQIYQNFDCFVCNNAPQWNSFFDLKEYFNDTKLVFPYSLTILCKDSYLDFKRYISFYSTVRDAKISHCRISFDPTITDSDVYFPLNPCPNPDIKNNRCNSSGQSVSIDRDIEWACEQFGPYWHTQQFCLLCDTKEVPGELIKTCNSTGICSHVSDTLSNGCELLPSVYEYPPYKNFHCLKCNRFPCTVRYLPDISEMIGVNYCLLVLHACSCYGAGCVNPLDIPGVKIRNLFQVTRIHTVKRTSRVLKCRENQILDTKKNVCRNVTCYPGRYLLNMSLCMPLFTVVSNIRYQMKIKIKSDHSGIVNLHNYLILIRKRLVFFMEYKINASSAGEIDIVFLKTELSSAHPCNYTLLGQSMNVILFIDLFIKSPVFRERIENDLIYIGRSVEFVNDTILTNTTDEMEDQRPLTENSSVEYCQLLDIETNPQNLMYWQYRATMVKRQIVCPQVVFDQHEYIYNKTRNTVIFRQYNLQLNAKQFLKDEDDKVIICIDDILPYFNNTHQKSTMELALEILTTVCTCVSLLCLILTFLTYCCFGSLRTLPGKNNMCLIFALAIAQASLQFGTIWTNNKYVCQTVGVVLHTFWLATFGCMNVCSFHMFKSFSVLKPVDITSNSNNQLIRYMLYSFGVPVLIVLTNIAIHLGISRGKDIGYGENKCFISYQLSQIISFICPVGIILLVNIVLFGIVTYGIYRRPNIQSTRDNRSDFIIYIKLFTLTGITWVGQIVDSYLPLSPFSFIVTLLTGLQGLFIFFSYTCNGRVLAMCKFSLGGEPTSRTSSFNLTAGSSRKEKSVDKGGSTKI